MCDKDVCARWCERWCVTKMVCHKVLVKDSVRKILCHKNVCVTKMCVKDGVGDICAEEEM